MTSSKSDFIKNDLILNSQQEVGKEAKGHRECWGSSSGQVLLYSLSIIINCTVSVQVMFCPL